MKISTRCPACGASTRDFGEAVLFCPECGKPLSVADKEEPVDREHSPETVTAAAIASSSTPNVHSDEPQPDQPSVGGKTSGQVVGDRASARERTRETLQRASQRTRGAIESNVKRAEKIHHVSSVMLEEATYDPSLRFVLVALGLFLLAVILLVLSKVMG